MVANTVSRTGSAQKQSQLWGARARDWADVQENVNNAISLAVLDKLEIGPGVSLLDVGCGAGGFAQMAARKGAKVSGLDATQALVDIAKERTPQGDFRCGEMEELPFADNSFDIVTGFNAFQYAADPANALREAGRVAKEGAPVVIAIWGKPEECEAAGHIKALGPLMPPPPPGTPGPFALSEDGALEALVRSAGLTPESKETVECIWEYPDLDTALKGMLSAGPIVRAQQTAGEERVRDAVVGAIEPYKTADGGYRLKNQFIYLVARS